MDRSTKFSLMPKKIEKMEREEMLQEAVYHDDQNLGAKIKEFDIRCKFQATTSKWYTNDKSEVKALLYFSFEFKEESSARLKSGSVNIDIGKPYNKDLDQIITDSAPKSPIKADPIALQIHKDTRRDPELSISGAGVEGTIKGFSKGKSKDFNVERGWHFKAGYPSDRSNNKITKVEFTWTRGLSDDCRGLDRAYIGALLLKRDIKLKAAQHKTDQIQEMRLGVGVNAVFCSWRQYFKLPRNPKLPPSFPIGPCPSSIVSEHEFLKRCGELPGEIIRLNKETTATGKHILIRT